MIFGVCTLSKAIGSFIPSRPGSTFSFLPKYEDFFCFSIDPGISSSYNSPATSSISTTINVRPSVYSRHFMCNNGISFLNPSSWPGSIIYKKNSPSRLVSRTKEIFIAIGCVSIIFFCLPCIYCWGLWLKIARLTCRTCHISSKIDWSSKWFFRSISLSARLPASSPFFYSVYINYSI